MSGGYVPLFESLTTGSLCGQWPDIGLWGVILSMADRNGVVDKTPFYISQVSGLPIADVEACLKRYCSPDPKSRSQVESGARLVLLDPSRQWGWRIVNHRDYREKARKAAYDAQRASDGRNAERMAARRKQDPTRPAGTRANPPSDSNINININEEKNTDTEGASRLSAPDVQTPGCKNATVNGSTRPSKRMPDAFQLDASMREWASLKTPDVDLDAEFQACRDYEFSNPHTDWAAVLRTWLRREQKKLNQRKNHYQGHVTKFEHMKARLRRG